tara:strand:- start:203 stop:616 length:414 start_codon:yes stop_codon:yes gene_type:complete
MKFQTLVGGTRSIPNAKKYLIDWKGKSRSKIQFAVKHFLSRYWVNKVVFEEFPMAGTRLSFDIYNANDKIAIEVQGQQHTKYTPFFHGKYKINYIDQLRRDKQKLDFCELNSIKLVEVYYNDTINKELFTKQGIVLL